MREEFGVAECPHCYEKSVRVPVLAWEALFEAESGTTVYVATYGNPRCTNNCKLDDHDRTYLDIEDHAWEDM